MKPPTEILMQASAHETILYTVSAALAAEVKTIFETNRYTRPKMTLARAIEVAKGRLTRAEIGEIKVERRKVKPGLRGHKANYRFTDII